MELAMVPRVLPSLPQSRHFIAKPILRSSHPIRARIGLVRSGSDFWARVNADSGEEPARVAVAEKEDEAPLEKDEEVKEEVSFVDEEKEEASFVEEEKEEVSSVEEVKEEVSSVEEVKEEVPEVAEVKEELVSSEEVSEEQSPATASDLLDQLNINLDTEDKPKLIAYGAGALVALWISSVVVSAVDSIPLFPKLMEIVGLGYTVWFSSRYLLFKDNRDELFSKIVELKEQVLGSDDE